MRKRTRSLGCRLTRQSRRTPYMQHTPRQRRCQEDDRSELCRIVRVKQHTSCPVFYRPPLAGESITGRTATARRCRAALSDVMNVNTCLFRENPERLAGLAACLLQGQADICKEMVVSGQSAQRMASNSHFGNLSWRVRQIESARISAVFESGRS